MGSTRMGAGGRRNLSFQHQGKEIYEQCRSRSRSTCSTPPPSSLSVLVPPGMGVVVSDCYMMVQYYLARGAGHHIMMMCASAEGGW